MFQYWCIACSPQAGQHRWCTPSLLGNKTQSWILLTEAFSSGGVGEMGHLPQLTKKWTSGWVGQTLCARYFEVRHVYPGPWSQPCRSTSFFFLILFLCFSARLRKLKPSGMLYNKQVEEIALWDRRCDGPKVIILLSNQGERRAEIKLSLITLVLFTTNLEKGEGSVGCLRRLSNKFSPCTL